MTQGDMSDSNDGIREDIEDTEPGYIHSCAVDPWRLDSLDDPVSIHVCFPLNKNINDISSAFKKMGAS